jgi:hypothetical protein
MNRSFLILVSGSAFWLIAACGGGSYSAAPPPPPPPPSVAIATSALADGAVGFAYSQTIQAQGGVAPFMWSVSTGSLPSGTALGGDRTIL